MGSTLTGVHKFQCLDMQGIPEENSIKLTNLTLSTDDGRQREMGKPISKQK